MDNTYLFYLAALTGVVSLVLSFVSFWLEANR